MYWTSAKHRGSGFSLPFETKPRHTLQDQALPVLQAGQAKAWGVHPTAPHVALLKAVVAVSYSGGWQFCCYPSKQN